MKIVKVIYTAKPEFADQNQVNVKAVMNDLQELKHPGIFYHSCVGPDGKTFIHTAFFQSEEDHQLLNALPSFKYFQEQLKAAGFEAPPKQELLTLVGSSKNIFN
jgi:hypothetical protein